MAFPPYSPIILRNLAPSLNQSQRSFDPCRPITGLEKCQDTTRQTPPDTRVSDIMKASVLRTAALKITKQKFKLYHCFHNFGGNIPDLFFYFLISMFVFKFQRQDTTISVQG